MQDASPFPSTTTAPQPVMVLPPSVKATVPLLGTGETVAMMVSGSPVVGDGLVAAREVLVAGWAKLIAIEPASAATSSDSSLKFSKP